MPKGSWRTLLPSKLLANRVVALEILYSHRTQSHILAYLGR